MTISLYNSNDFQGFGRPAREGKSILGVLGALGAVLGYLGCIFAVLENIWGHQGGVLMRTGGIFTPVKCGARGPGTPHQIANKSLILSKHNIKSLTHPKDVQ